MRMGAHDEGASGLGSAGIGQRIECLLLRALILGPVEFELGNLIARRAEEHDEGLGLRELDDVPEQAFLNVGGVEQVLAKAKALQEGAA